MTSTTLGTSNLRGSSSRTRNLPARTSRNARGTLRQNSLLSIPTSAPGQALSQTAGPSPHDGEPHGFYPAISHFTDAITALPRDFRRHSSLLKEVDAKAWTLEENLQKLLQQCLEERQSRTSLGSLVANTVAGSVSSVAGDNVPPLSTQGSTTGNMMLDTPSQYSAVGADGDILRRRRLYAELRSTLMQMIMPLDEKNHVINNANEELSKHIRRQDEIWPHVAMEISEETRLGSLKHWALVDLNPPKKTLATGARGRDAALLPDNEVAERSERRREAMALAKKQKTQAAALMAPIAQQMDSDTDLPGAVVKKPARKGVSAKKGHEIVEQIANAVPMAVSLSSAGAKASKPRSTAVKKVNEPTSAPMTRLPSGLGGVSMSRETSQQENSKKRKAPAPAAITARKRLNATANESPKLPHLPLAGTFTKEASKRSPALQNVRPVNGRARQNSNQSLDTVNRPSSAASKRNGVTATGSELERVAVATNKTTNEVKQTMKESVTAKGEKMLEEDVPDAVENKIRGGILLERSASKSSQLRREDSAVGRRTASPRLNPSATLEQSKFERSTKGKLKISTPKLGTFADADASESNTELTGAGDDLAEKLKRPARPRMKDHHGLHDSLSPKGLPTKRTHKKNGSYSIAAALATRRERDDEPPILERKSTAGRTNSRSVKAESSRDIRNASSTPKIGTELVEEPDSMVSTGPEDMKQSASRRQSHNPKHATSRSSTTTFDVRPPPSTKSYTSHPHRAVSPPPRMKTETPIPNDDSMALGSPGPEVDDDADDADVENENEIDPEDVAHPELEIAEDDDEEDPNEQTYCYCNGVSYGEMVACDNEACAKEWFHLECTGLRSLPPARTAWFCEDCRNALVA